jgi:acetyltransferase
MSIRNLEYFFRPRSIALVGASTTAGSVGATIAKNLDSAGFAGPIWPVNARHTEVAGAPAYPTVAALPAAPELAVICTPPETVPGIVAELGARGTRAAIVITAGFGERGSPAGKALEQSVVDAARPHWLRIVGPNCLGVLAPRAAVNASFAHLAPGAGPLAFVAQSGALVTAVIDWAAARGIGFSHLVSLGDMIDVDFGDVLDYLANDRDTHAILLYIEAITHARKFMSAARAAARSKPVIVVKSGRHAASARAVASHTGALAGADAVYDAAFRRAGIVRVHTLEELFDAAAILGARRVPAGERLVILTNGGGIGILATDAVADRGEALAELSSATIGRLDTVLPATWSHGNPIDIIGDADPDRYARALGIVLDSGEADAVLVLHCPTAIAAPTAVARGVIDRIAGRRSPFVFTSWVGEHAVGSARELFAAHGVPTYATPEAAIRAYGYLHDYRHRQTLLLETPPSLPVEFEPDRPAARAILAAALDAGREWLDEAQAKAVLSAYAVPVATSIAVDSPEAAAAHAARLAAPVALKIRSPDLTHKSDGGGVALDLDGPEVVLTRARAMLASVAARHPGARLEGFTIGPMVRRAGAHELILGVHRDAQFGPVILFGAGGTAVEAIDDTALALPPLNLALARALIGRTRIHRVLRGARGAPPAAIEAIALTLIKIAHLAADLPQLVELDVNPLIADARGVIAVDARIRVQTSDAAPGSLLAIRPYPAELAREVALSDGTVRWLRPIAPEDEPALRALFADLTPEQLRLRFFVPMKALTHVQAARFTQIDYDRDMAFVLTDRGAPGTRDIDGVVNLSADPGNEHAEFAIVVANDMAGHGIGTLLMRSILEYARKRGLLTVYGEVLAENTRMLELCRDLGFAHTTVLEAPGIIRVTMPLGR